MNDEPDYFGGCNHEYDSIWLCLNVVILIYMHDYDSLLSGLELGYGICEWRLAHLVGRNWMPNTFSSMYPNSKLNDWFVDLCIKVNLFLGPKLGGDSQLKIYTII